MDLAESRAESVTIYDRSATRDKCQVEIERYTLTFERKSGVIVETYRYANGLDTDRLSDVSARAAKLAAERYMDALPEPEKADAKTH